MTIELNQLKKKLNQTLTDTKSAMGTNQGVTKRLEKELWSATAEKKRFEQVLEKIQDTVLTGGGRVQEVVEEMKRCSKTLAIVDAERQTTINEIDDLEQKLACINASNDNNSKLTAIQ